MGESLCSEPCVEAVTYDFELLEYSYLTFKVLNFIVRIFCFH